MSADPSDTSVVVSTYRRPRALELTLLGYRLQSVRGFEIVVADDGSGPETAHVVRRAREEGLDVRHVWQEDRGFRKTEALNRAILAARGAYLVFSDGDCVPRRDFVETHLRLAEPGRFLSGGYLKLPERTTRAMDEEAVVSQRAFDLGWLRRHGYRPGRRALRLTRSRALATLLDALTPTRPTWNGHSSSTWKEDLVAVNGFDLGMGYGGEDSVIGDRLENLGVRGKQIRHRAVCVHLHHVRPYLDPAVIERNRALRAAARARGETRAPRGLAELADVDDRASPRVRVAPEPAGGEDGR